MIKLSDYKFRVIEKIKNNIHTFTPEYKEQERQWTVVPQDVKTFESLYSYDSLTLQHAQERIECMIKNIKKSEADIETYIIHDYELKPKH
jgi:hypothetical protein